MRDNISIIFAAIFAVMLLIVFPLFSLLTRQDNIAYNKVLAITTEFVDSVRTKGYFTEKEYSNYLIELAATRNTYKVDMEWHQKVLIKDVNRYTDDNPVWVEDTAVYYNSYIENVLESSDNVVFEEGDEFYIKLYNTNITTASLLYNFFLNSRIPRKIINIGYGGKILNSTGDVFSKTVFSTSYTPYVTFGEIVDKNGKDFELCYDQAAGTYAMKTCAIRINIDDLDDDLIKLSFQLHNFAKIGEYSLSATSFEEDKSSIKATILKSIVLRGNYIDNYDIDIENLTYTADIIEGTIVIKNIKLGRGAWRTTAHVVVMSDLGIGPTGATSVEGATEEITLTRADPAANITIEGPYSSTSSTEVITEAIKKDTTVYYKAKLKDTSDIRKLEIYDTKNLKVIGQQEQIKLNEIYTIGEFNVKITPAANYANTKEYWISVTPKFNDNPFMRVDKEVQVGIYADTWLDLNISQEVKALSNPTVYKCAINFELAVNNSLDLWEEYNEKLVNYGNLSHTATLTIQDGSFSTVANAVTDYANEKYGGSLKSLFDELLINKIIYLSTEETNLKYDIKISSVNPIDNKFVIYFDCIPNYITGGPEEIKMNFNIKKNGGVLTKEFNAYKNIPSGYSLYKDILGRLAIRDGEGKIYYWLPVTEKDFDDKFVTIDNKQIEYEEYFGEGNTDLESKIKNSITKYKGIYISKDTEAYGEKFHTAWDNTQDLVHSQLFSTMIYPWQFKVANKNNLVNNNLIWLAALINNQYVVHGYDFGTNDGKGTQYNNLRVLYIK